MAYNNSPLIAMSPLASQTNGLHRHREPAAAEGSNSYSPATSSNHQQEGSSSSSSSNMHQIPFQANPVQHGPTPLTFGFGFGSSIGAASTSALTSVNSPSTSAQWAHSPSVHGSPSHRNSNSTRSASAVSGKRNETKRRRDSDSDDSDDDMEGGIREKSASPMSYNRIISSTSSRQALPKRMRAGLGAVGLLNLNESRPASPRTNNNQQLEINSPGGGGGVAATSASAAVDKVDLGKILSTLDKPALLTLFSRLLTNSNDATLRDQVIAHIPAPSLESVESSLDEIERSIRTVSARSGEMRAEFAWGRLRNPVGDFVATSLGFMPFFIEDTKAGGVLSLRQEMPHPSTSFNFLLALTIRTLRIIDLLPSTPTTLSASLFSFDGSKTFQFGSDVAISVKTYQDLLPADSLTSANPNTIVTQLIPSLLTQWSRLQEKLCKGVNEEGRMFGSEMMRSWIGSLDALGSSKLPPGSSRIEERAFRTAIDGICSQLENGLGWLVGLPARHNTGAFSSSGIQHSWKSSQGGGGGSSSRASTHMDEEEEL